MAAVRCPPGLGLIAAADIMRIMRLCIGRIPTAPVGPVVVSQDEHATNGLAEPGHVSTRAERRCVQVDVLEYYETSVRSASAQFLIPAVLRVRMYVSKREFKAGRLSLSRRNIVLRDRGMCQCARAFPILPSPGH